MYLIFINFNYNWIQGILSIRLIQSQNKFPYQSDTRLNSKKPYQSDTVFLKKSTGSKLHHQVESKMELLPLHFV